jgi:hypothetical protein
MKHARERVRAVRVSAVSSAIDDESGRKSDRVRSWPLLFCSLGPNAPKASLDASADVAADGDRRCSAAAAAHTHAACSSLFCIGQDRTPRVALRAKDVHLWQ